MSLKTLFDSFFDHVKDIITLYNSRKVQVGVDIVGNKFESYLKIYAKSLPEDHVEFFLEPFKDHKEEILTGKFGWIRNGSVTIQFGRVNSARILFSIIYNNACTMAKEATAALDEGKPGNYDCIKYPDMLTLRYYRIVKATLDDRRQEDIARLASIIEDLETSLKLEIAPRKVGPQAGPQALPNPFNGQTLGSIFKMANQALRGTGVTPGKMPNSNDIGQIFNNVSKSVKEEPQNFSGIINQVIGTIKENKGIQETIKTVKESVENGYTLEKTLSGVSNAVKENFNLDISEITNIAKDTQIVDLNTPITELAEQLKTTVMDSGVLGEFAKMGTKDIEPVVPPVDYPTNNGDVFDD